MISWYETFRGRLFSGFRVSAASSLRSSPAASASLALRCSPNDRRMFPLIVPMLSPTAKNPHGLLFSTIVTSNRLGYKSHVLVLQKPDCPYPSVLEHRILLRQVVIYSVQNGIEAEVADITTSASLYDAIQENFKGMTITS